MKKLNFLNNNNQTGFNEFIISDINILNTQILTDSINLFFTEIVQPNKKYFCLITIEYGLSNYITLSNGKIISSHSLNDFIKFILSAYNFRQEDYNLSIASKIIFKYFEIPIGKEDKYKEKWEEISPNIKIKLEKFGKFSLPSNNLYSTWGNPISDSLIINENVVYYKNDLNNNVKIDVILNGKIYFTFTDIIDNNKNYDFIRLIKDYKYYIKDNKIILTTKELPTNYLKSNKLRKIPTIPKFIIFDIETLLIDNVHKPYLYAMYDGSKTYSWFTDQPYELFNRLLRSKYKGYNVYAHNLSKFDIVFIFKYLSYLNNRGYKISILMRDQIIISISIIKRSENIKITILDSYLILPTSLSKLSKQFQVENPKLIEPVFIGEGYDNYKMNDLSHYTKEIEKINDFNIWKDKIEKYCITDCISLYQVIYKFRELIIDKFNIDILNYPTIPSLAFAIYRQHYLHKNIPITTGKVFDFIKESFTGGRTDMYKPNALNKDIYCYDVNSLYPYVMSEFKYPVGPIIQFDGDPTILEDKYWIGDVSVSTKEDMFIPPIQIHHSITKKIGGIRTISPNGSFNIKLNSIEYESYKEFYNYKINSGYLFDKDYIFTDIIKFLYNLRTQYPKSDPMNYISKLLMNSLFGRFAMRNFKNKFNFFNRDDLFKMLENENIEVINYIDLNESLFINYIDNSALEKESKTSISIASAVTAYARSYMFNIIKDNLDHIYYSDTDSLYLDKPLNKDLISSTELGKLKLEYIFKDSVYIGPKIYAGITTDNKYICKIKGFKKSVDFELMKSLLIKDSKIKLNHVKWFRSLVNSNITLKDQIYELQKTENKRKIIYDLNDIGINTEAYNLKNTPI